MDMMEDLVADKGDAISAENVNAGSARVFNVNDYHQIDIFLGIEQIEDPNSLLHDVSLSHVASLRASVHVHGFSYPHCTWSVIFHSSVSARVVTTRSNGGNTVGRQVLNNSVRVLLLDGLHGLEARWQLHVEGDLGWIQQHT